MQEVSGSIPLGSTIQRNEYLIYTLADEVSSAGVFGVYGSFPEKVAPTFSVREATRKRISWDFGPASLVGNREIPAQEQRAPGLRRS